MIRYYQLDGDRIVEAPAGEGNIFLYINPGEDEKAELVSRYLLDEHTLNSSLDPDEQSRLEFEPGHTALIYKRPKNYLDKRQLSFKTGSIGAFLFPEKLILVLAEDQFLFDSKIFSRVSSLREIVLRLIYRAIFHFLEHLRVINMITDELETKIDEDMDNSYLLHLFSLEKSLVYYQNSITSNAGVIEKLRLNAAKIGFVTGELELLDDIMIENGQCFRQAEIYSTVLSSMMDARSSVVANNMNARMKTLTIITLGIMVPTFVVSAFSMNVRIPMQGYAHAFWIVLFLAALSVIFFAAYGWMRKW